MGMCCGGHRWETNGLRGKADFLIKSHAGITHIIFSWNDGDHILIMLVCTLHVITWDSQLNNKECTVTVQWDY